MSDETPPEGGPDESGGDTGLALTAEQQAVLREHNIEVPEDGKISIADHLKLLGTLSNLRKRERQSEKEKEQARLAAMSDLDRKVEEARSEGRKEAESAAKLETTKAWVKAAAVEAQFITPADAFGFLPEPSALQTEEDVAAAIKQLAQDKPYLIKRQSNPRLEGGPQGGPDSQRNAQTANDWIRGVFNR